MKRLSLLAMVVFAAASANAQFSFGIKAGYNRNGVYTRHIPNYPNYKSKDGFHIGLYSQFPLTDKLSLNPELQYIKKGPAMYQNYNLNYLEIPVLLNYQVWKSLSVEIGPTIGAPIFGDRYNQGSSWIDMDFAEYALDAGFVGGLKYQITDKVFLSVRYNRSLMQFDYYSALGQSANFDLDKAYLKNVQFSLMYKLK